MLVYVEVHRPESPTVSQDPLSVFFGQSEGSRPRTWEGVPGPR